MHNLWQMVGFVFYGQSRTYHNPIASSPKNLTTNTAAVPTVFLDGIMPGTGCIILPWLRTEGNAI